MLKWSESLYARVAAIGAGVGAGKKKVGTSTITSEPVQNVKGDGVEDMSKKKEVRRISPTNIEKYVTHHQQCSYWDDESKTHEQRVCDCGFTAFNKEEFLKSVVAVQINQRIKKACTDCSSNKKIYAAKDGFYHRKISEEILDDFCDASELWEWLYDLGFLKFEKKEEQPKEAPKTPVQEMWGEYGM